MMAELATRNIGSRTLAGRLAEGPIPAEQAFRYATLLGQALRDLHDTGRSHGAVSPETIVLTADGLELLPPDATSWQSDIPGDMFAFGSVLAEMLPGDRDAHGIGSLVAACLNSDSSLRPPNMRKALLELKVATLSARHSGKRAAQSDAEAALRAELEAMGARLTQLERNAEVHAFGMSNLEASVTGAIRLLETSLAEAVGRIERELGAQTSALDAVRRSMSQTDDLIGRVVENFEAKLGASHANAEDNAARLDILERGIRAAVDQSANLELRLVHHMEQLQTEVQSRFEVVESVRKSMAQTDDLVGRVVEAVETVLDLNMSRS